MSMSIEHDTPVIHRKRMNDGSTRLDVVIGDQSISHLIVVPITIRVGVATLRIAGISDVWTEEAYRNQGHARHLIQATVQFMQRSSAAISLLYGISDFYPKFSYTTIGPMYHLRITDMYDPPPLPIGWNVRPLQRTDLPVLKKLYEQNTVNAVGAAIRLPHSRVWSMLAETAQHGSADECRVVVDTSGQPVAYAWRGAGLGYVRDFERYGPDTLVLAEVMAGSATAADAVLSICCAWAAEESARRPQPLRWIYISTPPWGRIATAAAYRENWLDTQWFRSGGFMARTLNTRRLLAALQPELQRRVHDVRVALNGTLRVCTEEGAANLVIDKGVVSVQDRQERDRSTVLDINLPHTALTRLALGAFPPGDLLERLPTPPSEHATELLLALFPRRDIHLYLPDRP